MEIIDDDIGDSLIWAATRGHTSFLAKQLASVKQPEKYVNYVYDCDRSQKRTILTTAAMFGHENFVRYFLENFNPDIEALSDVIFEDDSNDEQLCLGVSALWAAAAANHLSIVKILVEHGANVNQTTSTNSTALRSACYNGNIIMVRYLISNGADVRIAKKNNDTNLAVTVYRKHLELSKYLVEELGCDVNQCDDDGRSPLFDAVNGGSLELTTFLLAHGARNRPAISDRMTPLMWAAEKSRSDLVDAIGESCSILEQIEAEELLGSALICCDLTKRRPHQAIEHWSRALQLRGLYNIHKELKTSSLPFKEKHEECRTVNDLKRYPTCLDSIWIEALLVRERILGVKNGEYRYSVQYQGAVLLDNQHFDQGLSLWLYEARIRVDNNISFSTQYFHNFISLFCEMLYKNIFVSQSTIQFIFDLTMKQLEIDNTNFDTYFQILLYLITVYSKHLKKPDNELENSTEIYRRIRLIQKKKLVRRSDQATMLHLCLDENVTPQDVSIDRICRYPCYSTAELLIYCGADINAINRRRETPLLVYVANYEHQNLKILDLLYENGAYIDQPNRSGLIPIEITFHALIYDWLRSKQPFNLKSLCARLIQKQMIRIPEQLNRALVDYVRRH